MLVALTPSPDGEGYNMAEIGTVVVKGEVKNGFNNC
jgi:hypothetical protein